MSNINRDYLIVLNPKTSKVTVPELNYYIYDKYTANLFVNLVATEGGKVVNLPDADQYKLVLHVLKPTNEIQTVENIQVFNKEKALFQIELDQELTKNIGRYKCELLTVDKTDHITQSVKFSYRVKKSIYNDLDVVTETPQYPIIINLLDKLQDIDKYEEERRANEVARVAAEQARVKDYTDLRQTVTTDIDTMQEKIDGFDGKVQEVDNAVQQMKTNINKYQSNKNKELDSYKTQKDTQINTAITNMENTIDTYKTEKDTQINDKFNQQDTKITTAINTQNKNIQDSANTLNDELNAAIQDQNNELNEAIQDQNKVINDAITEQNKTINNVVENDKTQNDNIDMALGNTISNMKSIEKLEAKDVEHEDRMTAIEAVDVEQNNRLDAIEIKNDQQDGRLNDVEAKNKKQDLDLKCLFAESHSERITLDNEVGNSVFLQNSKQGFATIDELKGNTLVNCNKDTDKELILNGNIDTSGYGTVTTTEGVDGGKVDVSLQGNTMVNVCEQEDPVAITKSYIVETGNHIALEGKYDGKCRPNIYGNTLVNLALAKDIYSCKDGTVQNDTINLTHNLKAGVTYTLIRTISEFSGGVIQEAINFYDMSFYTDGKYAQDHNCQYRGNGQYISTYTPTKDVVKMKIIIGMDNIDKDNGIYPTITISNYMVLEGDYTNKPIPDYFTGMKSSFEDKLITDENDANNGKYKVDYKVTGKNKIGNLTHVRNWQANYQLLSDGGIKVTPTATTGVSFVVFRSNGKLYKGKTYKFNGNPTNESMYYQGGLWKIGDTTWIPCDNNPIDETQGFDVAIYVNNSSLENEVIVYPQLEEGTTATTYEPYKESIKTLYLNSPLLEGDTIEQSGNNIIHNHRYTSVVFDGSDDENWVYWGNNTDNGKLDSSLISFYLSFTNYKDFTTSTVFNNEFLIGNTVWEAKTEMMALNADNIMSFQVALLRSKLVTQDLAGFRQYLQQNPITVVYELATPTQEIISPNDNLLLDSYTNGHLDVDSVVPIDKVDFKYNCFSKLKYLYTNTDYTIQFESDNVGKLDKMSLGVNGYITEQNVSKGINKFNITTGDSIGFGYLDIYGIGFNMSKIVVTPKVDNNFGYFKGMKSVGECEDNKIEILSQNNLADIMDNNLSLPSNANTNFDVANIKGGKTYTIKLQGEVNKGFNLLNGYSDEWGFYTRESLARNCFSSTYVIKPKYDGVLRFNGYVPLTMTSITLTEGEYTSDTMPNYHPYKSNKKEILLNEPLRGLPNGVKDKYVIIDGKWYIERNCIGVQFKDLKYSRHDTYLKDEYPNVIGLRLLNTGLTSPIMCAEYAYSNNRVISAGQLITNSEGINIVGNEFFMTIQKTKVKTLDFNGIKNYFAENPIEFIAKATTPTYEPIDYNPFEVYTDTTHISNNSTIPCNMVIRNSGFNCILKPNTTYTVSSNNGLSTVTTKDSIGDGILRFYNKDTTSITKMSNVLVLEGDYVTGNPPIPAFFKGMESAFEQELVTDEKDEHYGKYKVTVKAVGKNLFNCDNTSYQSIGNNNYYGTVTKTGNSFTYQGNKNKADGNFGIKFNNIKLKPNTTYYLSYNYKNINADSSCYIRVFGDKFGKIQEGKITTFTTVDEEYYNFNFYGTVGAIANCQFTLSNIQIEQGDKATEYEPYKENNITFYLNEPLRGVGNVKDKVYVKEDKVIVERNCGSATLDGSDDEGWYIQGTEHYQIVLPINLKESLTSICNSFPIGYGNEQVYVYPILQGGTSFIRLQNSTTRWATLQSFKQYLQSNPITLIYPLATPVYEEVEYFDLKLFVEIFKDTTIIYNSNIPVTSTINYTFSVPIVEQVNTLSKDVTAVQESANTVMTLASIMEDEVNK